MQNSENNITFACRLHRGDEKDIRRITENTGFFTDSECGIAEELATEHIEKGEEKSGYSFVLAKRGEHIIGYSSYGHIAGTEASYDLYWIVMDSAERGKGNGRRLLSETEKIIRLTGGKNIYAETSSTALYLPTRAFYEANGYIKEAELQDFYRPGDNKIVYTKRLTDNC